MLHSGPDLSDQKVAYRKHLSEVAGCHQEHPHANLS